MLTRTLTFDNICPFAGNSKPSDPKSPSPCHIPAYFPALRSAKQWVEDATHAKGGPILIRWNIIPLLIVFFQILVPWSILEAEINGILSIPALI